MRKKHAIIIGAGAAGLTAAYYFLKLTDIKPVVLEKEKFIGGLARTMNFNGNRLDIGGHRFFSKDADILKLWSELFSAQGAPAFDDKILERESVLVEGGADPELVDEVFLNRNRVSRIFYRRKFFSYPVSLSLQTIGNLGLFEVMSIGASFLKAKFNQREETTLEDFMINRFGQKLYETFFRDYTTKVWGRSPQQIGADWGSQRIKGLSLGKTVLDFFKKAFGSSQGAGETSLIERFFYPKLGPGQLWEKLASDIKELGGEHLRTGYPIVYTSADSVFQIAAHEGHVPIEKLYEYCRAAREILQGEHGVGRVIARPFEGTYPDYKRTPRRHDFSLDPTGDTMMDALERKGLDTIGVGKISDIFAGRSISRSLGINKDNVDGMEKTLKVMEEDFTGLCFVNLVDFDMQYGHRRDIAGYAKAATVFDRQLGDFMEKMREGDVLMICPKENMAAMRRLMTEAQTQRGIE